MRPYPIHGIFAINDTYGIPDEKVGPYGFQKKNLDFRHGIYYFRYFRVNVIFK